LLVTTACARSPQQVVLTAEMPLHLEDHLDAATVTEISAMTSQTPPLFRRPSNGASTSRSRTGRRRRNCTRVSGRPRWYAPATRYE
jgi:hypothetical protein